MRMMISYIVRYFAIAKLKDPSCYTNKYKKISILIVIILEENM